jgi:hypothetical protein
MSRVFITGSSTGLGLMAAQLLVEQGHRVVLHGRDRARADDARRAAPEAEGVVVGDLSSVAQTRGVADAVNKLGRFDAVIHNAGVGYSEARRVETEDGLPRVFAVNTLAPYVLTALFERPKRLVYVSSGLHRGASANIDDLAWKKRPWQASVAYAESKLHDVLLSWPSPSPAAGPACSPTPWSRAGWRPAWAAGRARRSRRGAANPGVAGGRRRRRGARDRPVFLSHAPSGAEPQRLRRRPPGSADRRLIDACRALSGVALPT